MRYLFWLFYFLFGAASLAAQSYTLTVAVYDRETRAPLPFVSVQAGERGATTDDRGEATLTLPAGRYLLRASFTGYRPYEARVTVGGDDRLSVGLRPGATLSTVTVTDQSERTALRQPRMGVERLTVRELESIPSVLGERDVLRSLQLLPGVTAAGEASNGLSVRGGTLDQNLLLLDGAPVFTPTHLFGLLTVFTPDAVGGIDLYRGNIPARFGGRVSSVVDVRSRVPTARRPVVKGGVGMLASHLSLETPLDTAGRAGLILAGRAGWNDPLLRLVRRLRNTRSRFADLTLKLRYRPNERNLLTLTGFYAGDFYAVDLLSEFGGIAATGNEYAYLTLNGGLEWVRFLGDRLAMTTRVTNAHYAPELRFPQLRGTPVVFASGIDQQRLSWRVAATEDRIHAWSAGAQLDHYRLQPGRLRPGSSEGVVPVDLETERGVEIAVFAEDDWRVSERLRLSGGLRYVAYRQPGPGEVRRYRPGAELTPANLEERTQTPRGRALATYGGFEPRLGVSYVLTPALSLKASYARSRQYLQNIYNANSPLPTSRWKVADTNVGPQTADLVAAGFNYAPASRTFSLRTEVYYRWLTDLLEYKPGANFFLNPTVETDLLRGTGRAYGLEVALSRRQGRFTGEVNYAYARVENRVDGADFGTRINRGRWYPGYFDQPHTLSANLTLDEGKTHELGFNVVVQSNRPYTIPNGFVEINGVDVPLFLERNNARLPLYHRLDFSWTIHNIKQRRKAWTGDWVFTVYNVYGRDNAYNIYYQPRDAGTPALGLFGGSPFAAYRLSIFGAPVFSLAYKFTFRPRG